MPDSENNPNRRRFKRVALLGKSTILLLEEDKTVSAMIDNINRGGVGLLTKKPLPLQINVRVQLEFRNKEGAMVSEALTGGVVRSTEWNHIYIVGIEFSPIINETDHPHLFTFLKDAGAV
jgi:hypothetical protein